MPLGLSPNEEPPTTGPWAALPRLLPLPSPVTGVALPVRPMPSFTKGFDEGRGRAVRRKEQLQWVWQRWVWGSPRVSLFDLRRQPVGFANKSNAMHETVDRLQGFVCDVAGPT